MKARLVSRNLIIDCLKELSDREYQESVWTGRDVSRQSSFIEAVEGLFTDSGLDDALPAGPTGFSDEVESKLSELDRQLKKVDTQHGPLKIINDPAMPRVRELGKEILALIESGGA